MQILANESRFGYDCEDRQSCKCETSQKSPDVTFDSALIIQFVTVYVPISRNQQKPEDHDYHLGCPCYLSLMRESRGGGGGGRGPDPPREITKI